MIYIYSHSFVRIQVLPAHRVLRLSFSELLSSFQGRLTVQREMRLKHLIALTLIQNRKYSQKICNEEK